jgi:hypothetical protein
VDDKKKPAGNGQHEFFARLPAATYRHLRSLAALPPVSFDAKRKALLLRLPADVYTRLRRLSVARAYAGYSDAGMSMQSVLVALIEESYDRWKASSSARCKREQSSMAAVVTMLIRSAKVKPSAPIASRQPASEPAA